MASKLAIFFILLSVRSLHSSAKVWIKSGFWLTVSEFPAPEIDSSLFTHLFCAFAGLNASSFELSIPSMDEQYFSSFTSTVKQKNPSVITLLSIGDSRIAPIFIRMLSTSSYRKSFIRSSIKAARLYEFDGIDIACLYARFNTTSSAMEDLSTLLGEWRAAIDSEAKIDPKKGKLILTMALYYLPSVDSVSYPIDSIQRNFDWVHLFSFDYFVPKRDNFAHPHAALYDPWSNVNTDYGISEWISSGFSVDKIVLGLPYHGYAWTLENPNDNGVGAPAWGPGITLDGSMSYKFIKGYVQSYKAQVVYNASYVENYCTFGSFWVGFDDVEAIRAKVSYAKQRQLLGYNVFQVGNDDNWALSQAAAEMESRSKLHKRLPLEKALIPAASFVALVVGSALCFLRRRQLKYRRMAAAAHDFGGGAPDLKVFTFSDIKTATGNFSSTNKLGEGGFGPVYKGKLRTGQEVAVKRLSKTSSQGFEEFRNEVILTAKLQHVNLVKVMGFCMEREEKMLIYDYLPNKSLDFYIFDPRRSILLGWDKRVEIVEGIIQGLLYLQEYSRLTIIHRDLKASNILLDLGMRPKISDFGMARIFQKDEHEANTSRIVGTYGYVPPEYVKKGVYSTKYDVYSFGVLLLQMISGRRNNCYYGENEDFTLMEYAYELWKDGRGQEFMDPALDDSSSVCKLVRCMQIGLICVQQKQEDRPSMLEVSAMIKKENEQIMIPRRPAFSTKADEDTEHVSLRELSTFSICESTTEIGPR